MKKRIICILLAIFMIVPFVFSAQAVSSEEASVAIWVNGNWVAAKSLSGLSGDMWLEFPIDAAVLKDTGEGTGATNYVRITSNVANGTTADTQVNLLGSNCGWSNTYISHNWWVDSGWASLETVNADLAIEGWNGSQWIRIHNDHECVADTPLLLGNAGGSDFRGYARNIWTENNTLSKYTNFRVVAHFHIGSNLSVATGDILNLFPEENYIACTFCADCGGCQNPLCTLHHAACTCGGQTEDPPVQENANPSIAVYVNGTWVSAVSVKGLSGDHWVEIPIDGTALTDTAEGAGATNYVRITSNVANGSSSESQLNLLFSDCGWSNTFISHNWWVDSDWTLTDNCNADIAIEGWNGTQWIRIHNDHECVGDLSMQLGLTNANTYSGFARNIWIDNNTLANYTNFRLLVHCVIGASLAENEGDISALFPAENYHNCVFCPICGGCKDAECTLHHVPCECTEVCAHTNTEVLEAVPATCTEPGLSEGLKCLDCSEILVEQETIEAFGHDFVDGICSRCGLEEAHEHNFVPGDIVAPTCTEKGYTVYTCSCGESYKDDFADALGHDYAATITEPTCTEGGYTTYTCSRCEDSYTADETDALGHDYVDGICSRCGAEDPSYIPPTPVDPCEGYTDIDRSKWYHNAADFVISNGLMGSTQTEELTFEPTTDCTRSMIVSILYRLEGSPEVTYEARFPDVKADKWFTDAVIWAAQNGIVNGYDNGNFGPNDKITREQMAVLLKGYADYIGKDTSKRADLSVFPDGNKAKWSKEAVQWAVAEGLINGKAQNGKTYLDPQGVATRAEVAAILMNYVQNVAEG